MLRCAIWYHLYNLKNVKNTHEGVLLLACNFTKSNTPPWVFFTFLKLNKWYQIAQNILYIFTSLKKRYRDFNWSYFLNISDCMVSSNSLICSAKLIADNDFYKYKSS